LNFIKFNNLKFDNPTVAKKCETFIDKHIDEILSTEDGTNFLLNLPIKYFMSLCKSDALNIHSENTLIEFIQKYLKHRDELPKLPEEEVQLDLSLLTDAEKEAR